MINELKELFKNQSKTIDHYSDKDILFTFEKMDNEEFRITFYSKSSHSCKYTNNVPVYRYGMIQVDLINQSILSFMTWNKNESEFSSKIKLLKWDFDFDFIRKIENFKIIQKI